MTDFDALGDAVQHLGPDNKSCDLIHVRQPAPTKYWKATASDTGVVIQYWVEGRKPRTRTVPKSSCSKKDPVRELLIRMQKKINVDGYSSTLLGEGAPQKAPPPQPDVEPGSRKAAQLKKYFGDANSWF